MFDLCKWKESALKKLLFVCSGNTCRSPLAEGIAKIKFPQSLSEDIEITSAGSSAIEGVPASDLAVRVASEHGIDISQHKTRLLSRSLVKQADLIVTMSSKHRQTVGILEPSALEHTYLLTDFCDDAAGDVPDPINGDIHVYRRTFQIIEKCLDSVKHRLKELITG
jgi:protein-tyrosine-phosphatase